MEVSSNLILLDNINSGEVESIKCHKGKMKPFNPNSQINHCYICDNCGERLMITPNVIVE